MQKNEIKAAVMAPSIGSYQFVPHDITTDELFEFVLQHFRDERPESMRYYYVVHDHSPARICSRILTGLSRLVFPSAAHS